MCMSGNYLHPGQRNRVQHMCRVSHMLVGALLTLVLLVACGNQNTGSKGTSAQKKVSTPSPSASSTQEPSFPSYLKMPHMLPTPAWVPITLGPAPVLGIEGDTRVS